MALGQGGLVRSEEVIPLPVQASMQCFFSLFMVTKDEQLPVRRFYEPQALSV
jgi:hypothetical protein